MVSNKVKLLPADFSQRILVLAEGSRIPLPEWAASLVWLGAWCRSFQQPGKRLIVFAVLPTRELGAAFAGLGCLVAGAESFEDSLSWPTFKQLPTGQAVFWCRKSGSSRYKGNIIGFEEIGGAEFISVEITKAPRKAEVGSGLKINRRNFDDFRFTEEQPPTAPKAASFDAAGESLETLVGNLNTKWIWSDGAEGLIVSSVATFQDVLTGFSLSIGGRTPIVMSDLLCLGRNKGQAHAKLRIDHPKGDISGDFPLAILDGSRAFMVHEHLVSANNILVVLDRAEYREGIHDAALGLRSISHDDEITKFQSAMPDKLAPGIELAAYLIDGQ